MSDCGFREEAAYQYARGEDLSGLSIWDMGLPGMSKIQYRHQTKGVLTGDRPTGPLHLGHYVGCQMMRLQLQHGYETFIEIADQQALTDHFRRLELVRDSVRQVAMDYLAVGIDPTVATILL
jgi:hypothetical protein